MDYYERLMEHNERFHRNFVFPELLKHNVWHTTHPDRFTSILEMGQIVYNPPIPESERWSTIQGPNTYPYVRHIGGISLFDFRGFEPDKYNEIYDKSDWTEFVPFRFQWGTSFWIEIDEQAIKENFINGKDLLAKWRHEEAYKHKLMQEIEAACLSPIPVSAFLRVFKFSKDNPQFEEINSKYLK